MISPARDKESPLRASVGVFTTHPGTPVMAEASARTGTPMSFEFVNNNDKSRIRSHAMRESWRQRAISRTQRPRARDIVPRDRPRQGPPEAGESSMRESDVEVEDLEEGVGTPIYPRDAIYIDLRHKLVQPDVSSSGRSTWKISTVPRPTSLSATLYQSIGDAVPDPFNTIKLSRDDQALLHHWVTTYAHQAFGQPVDPTFDPIRDLYIPVDLSQVACVHAVLAHSACHIAYLRQDRNDSVPAIQHKMAAIRLVNEALNDPVKGTSDENISAVMRLLTFERYWGSEDAWKLHRKGLIQMLERRGGISTVSTDWRLEMRIQLITLLPRPRWNDPAFGPTQLVSEHPPVLDTLFNVPDNFERPHSDFLNFFEGVRVITQDIEDHYPAVSRAIGYLRASQGNELEETRLKCLFYIAIIFKDSNLSHFDLSLLNDSLGMTENIWSNSVESLRWLLLQGMGRGPHDAGSLKRTEELGQVARLLEEYPWRRMEDRLLNILLGRISNRHEDT